MVMVSATEMINKAHEGHYAVPAFNINNLEWTKAVLAGAQQSNSPVILGVSEGAGKYMAGFKTVADMVRDVHDQMGITVPVALHLDHGTFEGAKACIEAGFTSVMFDGSHYGFEENLEKSKEIIALAHSKGISVECEVGGIGGTEDGVTSAGELADPKECATIAALGVDFLAAGIGNIHGIYPANWQGLNFERLQEIQDAVNGKPLVLHGGSGIPFEQVHKAITLGVSKVNVNTELQLVFAKATREYIEAGKDKEGKGYDPRKLLKPGADAITAQVITMCEAFGSKGNA
ncbi:MAG: class II fructose-1,6-bisphosphate aldolase [Solobacterium sp.]|jgi:fructose-bisphosphate aldolase class II|nr:class II fructose-1,6-bisphosphate aldolase [Solobacterium sp.]MCH4222765.1 class II fructose-1,6-bisphosphate aldolase [Solobacterium sp.]MCH4265974.1 class II fructose-1,6-bisphosphate aldolase [Solobacterium sp.]